VGDSRHDWNRAVRQRKTAAVLWGPFDRADLEDLAPTTGWRTPGLGELYDHEP